MMMRALYYATEPRRLERSDQPIVAATSYEKRDETKLDNNKRDKHRALIYIWFSFLLH